MQTDQKTTQTWPELAEGLYGFLTGRGATIHYTFDNMEIWVPAKAGDENTSAKWKMNGTLRVTTSEK